MTVSEDIPTVQPRRQRYTVPIGYFPSLLFRFGYWERLDTLCQVFIGRSMIPPMRHDGVQQDDLNWFIAPADSPSCLLLAMAIQGIRGHHPEKGLFYFPSDLPCLCESAGSDSCLSLEAENTPDEKMFPLIHEYLFPASLTTKVPVSEHPGLGRTNPLVGVYGPLCADYTHHGRPEIHPYHWLWYLAPPPDSMHVRWLAAHLPDKSGRFHKWSPDTLMGRIQIPLYCSESVSIRVIEGNGQQHVREIGPIHPEPFNLDLPVIDGWVQMSVSSPHGTKPGYVEFHDRTGSGRIFEIISPLCP